MILICFSFGLKLQRFGITLRLVHDIVLAQGMPPHVFAMLEPFLAQKTLELRFHAALVVQMLAKSIFILIRSTALIGANEPARCNTEINKRINYNKRTPHTVIIIIKHRLGSTIN